MVSLVKIFLVDDDKSVLKILELLLEGSEFEVVGKATNGQIAVEKFKDFREKPDIIIMDYRMPIMNGIEATIEILKINNHSKVIFATADMEIKERALGVGVLNVIFKPFNFEQLFKVLNDLLNERTG